MALESSNTDCHNNLLFLIADPIISTTLLQIHSKSQARIETSPFEIEGNICIYIYYHNHIEIAIVNIHSIAAVCCNSYNMQVALFV